MAFGKKLQELLDAKNISIAEAARITGISDNTLRSIIARDSNEIGISIAVKISKAFRISIDDIQGWGKLQELPKDEIDALVMLEKKRQELLTDIILLEPDEQEQIEGMIRFFAKRRQNPTADK